MMATDYEASLLAIQRLIDSAIGDMNDAPFAEAESQLQRLLAVGTNDWRLYFLLAVVATYTNRNEIAIVLLAKAAEIAPNQPQIWSNLGNSYRIEYRYDLAEAAIKQALAIAPGNIEALTNLGMLHVNTGNPATAENYLRQALKINPQFAKAHWGLSLALLEQERWSEGFAEYAWGQSSGDRRRPHARGAARWNGQPAGNKPIIVYGEQGIGDEIMFASMIPDLCEISSNITFACHPRLTRLIARSFPSIRCVPLAVEDTDPAPDEKFHFHAAIGDLAACFRKSTEDFPRTPYLRTDPEQVERCVTELDALGDGPVIALSWKGGTKHTHGCWRSPSLDDWALLIQSLPRARWISVQYSPDSRADIDYLERRTGIPVHRLPEYTESAYLETWQLCDADGTTRKSFDDKPAALASLADMKDRSCSLIHQPGPAFQYDQSASLVQAVHRLGGIVVSVNNSMVHLCGALGIECLTITPSRPAWRYGLNRHDMVWYGSVRQFRQSGEGWSAPLREVTAELSRRYGRTT